jgi:hypothetical protein
MYKLYLAAEPSPSPSPRSQAQYPHYSQCSIARIINKASCRSLNCDPSRRKFYTVTLRLDCPEQQGHHHSAEVTLRRLAALWHLPSGSAPSLGVLEEPVSLVAHSSLCRVPRGPRYPLEAVELCTVPAASRQDYRHPRVQSLPLREEHTYSMATWYTIGLESPAGTCTCCKIDNMYVVIRLHNLCSSQRREKDLDRKNRH